MRSSGNDNARAKAILASGEKSVTTDHVLEAWALLHHRLGRRAVEKFWRGLREGVATIEIAGAADLEMPGK